MQCIRRASRTSVRKTDEILISRDRGEAECTSARRVLIREYNERPNICETPIYIYIYPRSSVEGARRAIGGGCEIEGEGERPTHMPKLYGSSQSSGLRIFFSWLTAARQFRAPAGSPHQNLHRESMAAGMPAQRLGPQRYIYGFVTYAAAAASFTTEAASTVILQPAQRLGPQPYI